MLARIAREKPSFLAGYERVCEGLEWSCIGANQKALPRNARKRTKRTGSTSTYYVPIGFPCPQWLRFSSEPEVQREHVRPAAEIDLGRGCRNP